MKHFGLGWAIAQFFLLSLVAYRLQRIVTTDSWPPSRWFSMRYYDPKKKLDEQSAFYDFITCSWCLGSWAAFAVFGLAALWLSVPLPLLQAVAGAAIVGQIGMRD